MDFQRRIRFRSSHPSIPSTSRLNNLLPSRAATRRQSPPEDLSSDRKDRGCEPSPTWATRSPTEEDPKLAVGVEVEGGGEEAEEAEEVDGSRVSRLPRDTSTSRRKKTKRTPLGTSTATFGKRSTTAATLTSRATSSCARASAGRRGRDGRARVSSRTTPSTATSLRTSRRRHNRWRSIRLCLRSLRERRRAGRQDLGRRRGCRPCLALEKTAIDHMLPLLHLRRAPRNSLSL